MQVYGISFMHPYKQCGTVILILLQEAPNYCLPAKFQRVCLTDDELTTGYYQQDGATCHTSNASMREIESFF